MGQKNALYFCAGLAIGILGTLGFLWFYQEPEENADKPVEDSVPTRPIYRSDPNPDGIEIEPVTPSVDYARAIHVLRYDGSDAPTDDKMVPYQITEEQFADYSENDIYDSSGLTLYSDDVVANSITDDVLTESELFTLLGPNYTVPIIKRIFTQPCSFEIPDIIYVRNERLFIQYEISYDERTYGEVTGRNKDGSY